MLTLELYLLWLRSNGIYDGNFAGVADNYKDHVDFLAYCEAHTEPEGYVISHAAKAEMLAGKKIAAIKIIRGETNLGLKEAKDIADAFQQTNECKAFVSEQTLKALREKLTGDPNYDERDYNFRHPTTF